MLLEMNYELWTMKKMMYLEWFVISSINNARNVMQPKWKTSATHQNPWIMVYVLMYKRVVLLFLPIIPFSLDEGSNSKACIEALCLNFPDESHYITSSTEIILLIPEKMALEYEEWVRIRGWEVTCPGLGSCWFQNTYVSITSIPPCLAWEIKDGHICRYIIVRYPEKMLWFEWPF